MFNYYKMKLKGSGGGPDTFALTMWIGGAGTFLSFFAMTATRTGFKGSDPVAVPIIMSVFYLFFLKFISDFIDFPKRILFYSTIVFSFMSLGLVFFYSPRPLGVFCLLYYGIAHYLTRKQWRHFF